MSGIGDLYNSKNVIVGQAAGFYGPENTPLPSDSITVFDSVAWLSYSVTIGTNTAGNYTLTVGGVTTSTIAFGATATAVQTAVATALATVLGITVAQATAYVSVTGTGAVATPWVVTLTGPAARYSSTVTATLTGLTGGAGAAITVSPWKAAGATEQGWQVNYNPNVQNINIEEQPTPVDSQVTDAVLTFVANLSEDVVESWILALSATATVQAPDTTHFGKTTLALQNALPRVTAALETKNSKGMPRRYYVPSMTVAANVGTNFRRAAQQRLIPVTFTSVCDLSAIQIVEITANHS